jgi:hypothetical protein
MNGLNQEIQIRIIAFLSVDYYNIETKFQLSFKTKVLQSIFLGHGDLWLAYTQKSHIGKSIIIFHVPLEKLIMNLNLFWIFLWSLIYLVLNKNGGSYIESWIKWCDPFP